MPRRQARASVTMSVPGARVRRPCGCGRRRAGPVDRRRRSRTARRRARATCLGAAAVARRVEQADVAERRAMEPRQVLPVEHVLPHALERRGDGALVDGDRHERHLSTLWPPVRLASTRRRARPAACPRSRTAPSARTASPMADPRRGRRARRSFFCHGFPELAYSWRHQVPALAAAGFRAIAPDQRGYGDTERPADVAAYDIASPHRRPGRACSTRSAIERAVFVGHDWGGLVVWQMPLLHPERARRASSASTRRTSRVRSPRRRRSSASSSATTTTSATSSSPASPTPRSRRDPRQRLHAAHASRRSDRARSRRGIARGAAHAEHGRDGLRGRAARRAAARRRRARRLRRDVRRARASRAASTGIGTSTATGRRRPSSTAPASPCRRSW